MLTDGQLAMLAAVYYEQSVEGAIGRLYEPSGLEVARFNSLVDMGLVILRKYQSVVKPDILSEVDYLEAVVTEEGILSLEVQGPVRIIKALLVTSDAAVPLEHYIKRCPLELLPVLLTSNIDFIREAARGRYKELNGTRVARPE